MPKKKTLEVTLSGPSKSFEICSYVSSISNSSTCIEASIQEDVLWRIGQVFLDIREDGSVLIHGLLVFSLFQNHGVSRYLIEESERIAKGMGAKKVELYTLHEYLKNSWCNMGYILVRQVSEEVHVRLAFNEEEQNDNKEREIVAPPGSFHLEKEFA